MGVAYSFGGLVHDHHGGEQGGRQGGMVLGRSWSAGSKQKERELGLVWGSETSVTQLLQQDQPPNPFKTDHQLGTKYAVICAFGGHSHLNHNMQIVRT